MTFTIHGDPVGKARPRFSGHAYTPDKTKAYEDRVRWAYKQAGGKFHAGAVCVRIMAYFKIPKSTTKKCRAAMLDGSLPMWNRPDADNIAKIILDGLNRLAYNDDKQVIDLHISKRYSEEPRVTVEICEMEE